MTTPTLTHLWLEAPLFADTLALLPVDVTLILPAASAPVYRNATSAQAIIASSMLRYNDALMDACPNLRLIARTGIGVDNIDLDAATARGIVVTNTPDGPTESTAEHTVAMLLALAKRLKQGNDNLSRRDRHTPQRICDPRGPPPHGGDGYVAVSRLLPWRASIRHRQPGCVDKIDSRSLVIYPPSPKSPTIPTNDR